MTDDECEETEPRRSRRRLLGQLALGSLGWVLVMMVIVSVTAVLVGVGWVIVQLVADQFDFAG